MSERRKGLCPSPTSSQCSTPESGDTESVHIVPLIAADKYLSVMGIWKLQGA